VRIDEEREERPVEAGTVIEIEVGQLRDRIDEVPEGPLVVICAHGTRSAEAVRYLASRGIQARYLGGGMSWRARAK
jgi:rhodanese-related sulfurtransferase